ncbi:hypothetical protein ACN28E_13810 [Archangium lansingense]|uniref:hypothetical protein n=1 Tax=Archangium lansingense TaxID=2995310 RepID=UPI003B824EC3
MGINILSKVALGLGLVLVAASARAATENVQWRNAAGVTVSGNSLTKNLPTEGWDAGASSTQAITSGDGFVEFTASSTTGDRVGGLSRDDGSTSFTDIDYGFYLSRFGTLAAIEGGNVRPIGNYVPGDVLRVAVEGGVVRYRKNGAHVETGTTAPTYPLVFDTALFHNGATITNGVISGNLTPALFNSPGGYAVGGVTIINGQGQWIGSPVGLQGPKGDKGDQGVQGIQGIEGKQGPPGPAVHTFAVCGDAPRDGSGACLRSCAFVCSGSTVEGGTFGSGCTATSDTGICPLSHPIAGACPMCCVCRPR